MPETSSMDEPGVPRLDVGGAVIEPVAMRADGPNILRGVLPAGVPVPLHSHDDYETFVILEGEAENLIVTDGQPTGWIVRRVGDVVDIPRGARHAWRNAADRPARMLIITNPRLGAYFLDAGTALIGNEPPSWPPTPEVLSRVVAANTHYGYWTGSPQENAAIGIILEPPGSPSLSISRWSTHARGPA